MNKSVQSLLREVDRGEKNFKKGDGRLPIFYNNGDTGATSRVLRLLEVGPPEPVRPFEPLLVKPNKGYSWQWKEAWIFPKKVLKKSEPMSISGGSWGPDGLLYCTGHDHPELYALRLPQAGSVLELVEIIPIENNGRGIARDRGDPGRIYSIKRPTKQVVASRLKKKGNP